MNPYENVPAKGFWRPAVADRSMFDIADLWAPKYPINRQMPVTTYGSCFAQHIGRALAARGFNWHITEPRPSATSDALAKKFNFDIFSSRTGNIYTATLLLQWLSWAFGSTEVPDEIWTDGDRFYDPFRPNIEPNGFASREELLRSRAATLQAFKDSVTKAGVFVFTMGLTERWVHKDGYEYPICPGTVAGKFDKDLHSFDNLNFDAVRAAMSKSIEMMKQANSNLRILLTVSPVPLTATYSGQHVLVATMKSKSILRAVAAQLTDVRPIVDYFPSYEIINSPAFRGGFFDPNMRNVNHHGVEFVMNSFFACQQAAFGIPANAGDGPQAKSREDLVCEEELLGKFAGQA